MCGGYSYVQTGPYGPTHRRCFILQTGAVSELSIQRRVHSYNDDYEDLDALKKRITQLNAEGLMDKQVAVVLNDEGVMSARGRPFTYENVWLLRQRWGIPAVKLSPTGPNPAQWPDGSYSVQGAAAAVGGNRPIEPAL